MIIDIVFYYTGSYRETQVKAKILTSETIVHLKEGAHMEMETTQIKGIDSTVRVTRGDLAENASLEIHEKIMTHGKQYAKTDFAIDMNGKDCSCNLVSRSVAKGESRQEFFSIMNVNAACAGHRDRKSTRLNSSHTDSSRMPSSA